ncbi:hypothetical protein ASPWEDRAFT_38000 [Aspergillus wentii DTO 134E9]|uniref:Pyruvate decarboxylase n=1 Tax=Aspergillus wentii DTO 134E9 TaxID=1073089 RepID=A0A1L9RNC7_ASPWE|nr:uncharacterized protein ASPWEDRAFT_38000 [Aspergillus wentii DTO 134E9]KAI9926086.1 hypothetical protein MW887_004547 [Aspergillus wentii]OJJ36431.1 hypothetical protein ASPWEDRAFT_38000 [Aspergillus wentii DTO 134E9]
MTSNAIPLADYLFTRLLQLGVDSIFGLPGDYNLRLLDYVTPAGLKWIGNCNELNAGYAADGYSRLKGIGALVTTFGVGELSAVNAIAGAYAERAPVVHVVGTPPRASHESRAPIHHTFNDGEYQNFDRMQEHITVAQTMLWDHRTATAQIDHTLQQCLLHSRPVRITIPDDMVGVRVSAAGLQTKISVPVPVESETEEAALQLVLERIYSSKKPMIIVDGESRPCGILDEVEHIVKTTEWPTFTTGFGKGLINETLSNVHGVYVPGHKGFVDSCDLILSFGPHYSTTNSHQTLTVPRKDTRIDISLNAVQANTEIFRDLPAKRFVEQLISKLDLSKVPKHTPEISPINNLHAAAMSDNVTQVGGFWQRLSSFFKEGDVVMAETGTAGYGANEFALPQHTRLYKPVTWLSIGYMLPAALGASLAQRDLAAKSQYHGLPGGRTVLLIGDGSFQLTAQEMSTMIHHKLDIVIFLINNNGYTIERCIHGRNQGYNDITPWRYLKAPALFGAPEEGEYAAHTWEVRTWNDLEGVLEDEKMLNGKGIRMVEVFMDQLDAPKFLLSVLDRQIELEKKA